MTRCAHCPRAGLPGCEGEATPRLCELVDPSHPDHAPAYLAALEPVADPPAAPPPVPLSDVLLVRKMGGRNCEHGSPPACGCSGLVACALLGRDASIRDCIECLTIGPRAGDQGASP